MESYTPKNESVAMMLPSFPGSKELFRQMIKMGSYQEAAAIINAGGRKADCLIENLQTTADMLLEHKLSPRDAEEAISKVIDDIKALDDDAPGLASDAEIMSPGYVESSELKTALPDSDPIPVDATVVSLDAFRHKKQG